MKIRNVLLIVLVILLYQTKGFSQDETEEIKFDSAKFSHQIFFNRIKERKVSDKKLQEARSKLKWETEEREVSKEFSFSYLTGRIFLYIIIAIAIILVVILILRSRGLFVRKNILFEMPSLGSEHDIETFDFDTAIEKAVSENNYRAAVRYMYLQLLKVLSDKNILVYAKEKTNSNYLEQLYNTKYFAGFGTLTRLFEYTWYGEMMPDKARFDSIKERFNAFKSDLN